MNTLAQRLLHLEREDARLSILLHRLTRQRQRNQEEATRLRLSMRWADAEEYEARRLVAQTEAQHAWPRHTEEAR